MGVRTGLVACACSGANGTLTFSYEAIRPQLIRAGNLVTEKEAERRVLMLINPAMGKFLKSLSATNP